ncbi:MAG: alpha-1,2-fucosyltransferase [Spirochaetota bacterium]|nr:alpha-1,2-fucosyltransferase [Spirochaetota bacterium]
MNVIRLMGGLGNQLFQYSFGRAMKENGIEVKYDISNFNKSKHREFMLGNFTIDVPISTFINKKNKLDLGGTPSFDIAYLKMNGYNFFGYWQYLAYFENILPVLKKEIWLKKEVYTKEFLKYREIIQNSESVSVHVRRGDYLINNSIPTLTFGYYAEAFTHTKGDLFIFSDDIAWCKRYFISDYFERNITFISLPYYLDFELMKLCKHNVISNSTFSWWAAILNENPDKIVVTPNFWITKLDSYKRNNFPKQWIQLECDV